MATHWGIVVPQNQEEVVVEQVCLHSLCTQAVQHEPSHPWEDLPVEHHPEE